MPFAMSLLRLPLLTLLFSLAAGINGAYGDGESGDHVNDLKAHIDDYAGDVEWMLGKVRGLAEEYRQGGREAVNPGELIDYWESVKFHAAIESNHIPLYASIWQALYGIKGAMEQGDKPEVVDMNLAALEKALWQSLGAVKLAAVRQSQAQTSSRADGAQISPLTTLDEIDERLDRIEDVYKEGQRDDAVTLVHATYANLFEGIEGILIEQDADLVESLEKDFNVTLPQALEKVDNGAQVVAILEAMEEKLDRAETLIKQADEDRKDVF